MKIPKFMIIENLFLVFLVSLILGFVDSKFYRKEVSFQTIRTNETSFKFLILKLDNYLGLVDHILGYVSRKILTNCENSLKTLKQAQKLN